MEKKAIIEEGVTPPENPVVEKAAESSCDPTKPCCSGACRPKKPLDDDVTKRAADSVSNRIRSKRV